MVAKEQPQLEGSDELELKYREEGGTSGFKERGWGRQSLGEGMKEPRGSRE